MSQTRRQLASSLFVMPAAMALLSPVSIRAQDAPAFGALADPGNVFISPPGRPYRAKPGAPYPVVNWFNMADVNSDGKLDHAEFVADSLAFFKILDRNGDGVISPQELSFYEQRIAPEVLGMRVDVRGGVMTTSRPLLQRVQGMPGGMGGMGGMGGPPTTSVDPGAGSGESGSGGSSKPRPYDASGAGASPYSFFDEPEPVSAADIHYRGLISKADFLRLADIHFTTLDRNDQGYLTLDTLPKTPVERRLARARHKRS